MTAHSVLPPPPKLLTDLRSFYCALARLYALGHLFHKPAEQEHSTVEELADGVLLFRMRTTASLNCRNAYFCFMTDRYELICTSEQVSIMGPVMVVGISHFDLNMVEAYGWQVMLRVTPGEWQKDAEAPSDSREHRIKLWMEDMTDHVI